MSAGLNRADEVADLLEAVQSLIVPFVRAADEAAPERASGRLLASDDGAGGGGGGGGVRNVLVDAHEPEALVEKLRFALPEGEGRGKDGLLDTVRDVLKYSVNTWDQGFLDKLYATTNPVGVVSELLLAVLNTNLHVYQVSPALTVIEKATAKRLAGLFGFDGPRAGGISCQGGSASNLTSIAVARAALYPETKTGGNEGRRFALFTSAHGHYSVEKAAVTCGMGSGSVVPVAVDAEGRMIPSALRAAAAAARDERGMTPLYVNATAGTTVMGSFDPFAEVAAVAREFGMWLHVDGSWGGSVAFSPAQRGKLAGVELADSVTVNPHKMLNVPVTCSFLLARDMAALHRATTLPAGYLFHAVDEGAEVWDLADLTLQCGRRGDSLKLALAWIYYGADGLARRVDAAFAAAARLARLLADHPDFDLLSTDPPPCLQVCFYHRPAPAGDDEAAASRAKEANTARTKAMVAALVPRGYMVDYAPGPRGSFFRVVLNCETLLSTVDGLFTALREVGEAYQG